MAELGRLERINDIRTGYWPTEYGHFTPWLAMPENMQLLADAIGFDIDVEGTEQQVGPFAADIVGTAPDGTRVVIENQFGKTDHDHLGKLLTYAGSLDLVKNVVWIAEQFTAEHRAAIDWLNSVTGEGAGFFAVELQLWRIGNSAAAPRFNLIAWPNVAVLKQESRQAPLTPLKQLQLNYWTAFKKYLEEKDSPVKTQKPYPQHWADAALGRSGTHLSAIVGTWDEEAHKTVPGLNRVELVLDGANAKATFTHLFGHREAIEHDLGADSVIWHNPANANMCRIYVKRFVDFQNQSVWPEQFEWLDGWMKRFRQVFPKYFDLVAYDEEPVEAVPIS